MKKNLCKCGCGKGTPISKRNRFHLGHIKGQHIDYLKGHKRRGIKRPPFSESWKTKISQSRVLSGVSSGSRNPNWRGGLTKKQVTIRNLTAYKNWRKMVYKRDNFRCVICGTPGNGKNLQADHIIPLSVLLRTNSYLWDISNGRTLCSTCHQQTDTYGWKVWNSYLKPLEGGGLRDEHSLFKLP